MLKLDYDKTFYVNNLDISLIFKKVRLNLTSSILQSLIIFIASLTCKLLWVSIDSESKVMVKLTLQESGDQLSGKQRL